jgi:hypothetical protein
MPVDYHLTKRPLESDDRQQDEETYPVRMEVVESHRPETYPVTRLNDDSDAYRSLMLTLAYQWLPSSSTTTVSSVC